jgi:hypothetical protein|tara:strand:+ start:126 stop:308 length:183 start_codon:yes stop_codon:yes gene_type:complete
MNLKDKPEVQLELPNINTDCYEHMTKETISFPWAAYSESEIKSLSSWGPQLELVYQEWRS